MQESRHSNNPNELHALIANCTVKSRVKGLEKRLAEFPSLQQLVNQAATLDGNIVDGDRSFRKGELPLGVAIRVAIRSKNQKIVSLLLQYDADPNKQMEGGRFPGFNAFAIACRLGGNEIIKLFLESPKIKIDLNATFDMKDIGLQIGGKQINYTIKNATPLVIACVTNGTKSAELLLQHNANINHLFQLQIKKINELFLEGSLLAYSAVFFRSDLIQFLLENNISQDQTFNYRGIKIPILSGAIISNVVEGLKGEIIRIGFIKELIKHGIKINIGPEDDGPLNAAITRRNLDVVKLLVDKCKASIENPAYLIEACRKEDGIAAFLLDKGANPNVERTSILEDGPFTISPLLRAADEGYPNLVLQLLRKGADIFHIFNPSPEEKGYTALSIAGEIGTVELSTERKERKRQVLNILLGWINAKEKNHPKKRLCLSYALLRAACWGNEETVGMLLEHTNPNTAPSGGEINANDCGVLPLVAASNAGNVEIVKVLLEKGKADPNKENPAGRFLGVNPLIGTISPTYSVEILSILFEHGADVTQVSTKGRFKDYNVLSTIVLNDKLDLLELVLARYPKILTPDAEKKLEGIPPLAMAIWDDNLEAIKILWKYDVDVKNIFDYTSHKISNEQHTPLSLAVKLRRYKIVDWLINTANVSVNEKMQSGSDAGRPLIIVAVLYWNVQLIELLLPKADLKMTCGDSIFSDLNVWQIAILLCDQFHNASVLASLLSSNFTSRKQEKAFRQLIGREHVPAIFAAAVLKEKEVFEILLENSLDIDVTEKISKGEYKGESLLAAVALNGDKEWIRKLVKDYAYQERWNQIISSKRISPSKSILEIIREKTEDEVFCNTLLLTTNQSAIYTSSVIEIATIKPKRQRKFNLANLICQSVSDFDRKLDNHYYLRHAQKALLTMKEMLEKVGEEHLLEIDIVEECALRMMQSFVDYQNHIQEHSLLSHEICWSIRNLLMHNFQSLSIESLYILAQMLIENFEKEIEVTLQVNPLVLSFGLTVNTHSKKKSDFEKRQSSFSKWIQDNKTGKSISNNEDLPLLIEQINKIEELQNLMKKEEDDNEEEEEGKETKQDSQFYSIAIRNRVRRIGAIYQAMIKNESEYLKSIQGTELKEFLNSCKEVRNIIGHEFNKETSNVEDHIPDVYINELAYQAISYRADCEKLMEVDEEVSDKKIAVLG